MILINLTDFFLIFSIKFTSFLSSYENIKIAKKISKYELYINIIFNKVFIKINNNYQIIVIKSQKMGFIAIFLLIFNLIIFLLIEFSYQLLYLSQFIL